MVAVVALGGCTGCVERLIIERDGLGDGDGDAGVVDTDTDGPGDTESVPGESTGVEPGTECSVPQDCGAGQTCFEGVCVGTGSLRVSLSWTEVTDLDLHVQVPNGDWMSFENPLTDYGELDVDDCVAGICVNQNGTHVENIFLDATAPRGTYGIRVVNFDGRSAADYSIEVAGAVNATFTGSVPAVSYAESVMHQITW